MNAPSPIPVQSSAAAEPRLGTGRIPVSLFVALFIGLYWGMTYFDLKSGWFNENVYVPYNSAAQLTSFQPSGGGADLELGRLKYEQVCALCHNPDGAGKPNQAPPLSGSEWVLGHPNRIIRIPLAGLQGPLTVKGEQWNLAMPAMGATMSDEELAAVLTYMRQSWGNKAEAIKPEQVKAVRAVIGNRQAFSAQELEAVN